jgi:hypothetical protein
MFKTFIIILLLHIFAGYFLQSKRISKLKRVKKRYLFQHVGLYTLIFIVFSPLLLSITFLEGLAFSLINGCLHLAVDYFTGKIKLKYHKDDIKYGVIVGIDYTLHVSMLLITYIMLYPNAMNTVTFWDR